MAVKISLKRPVHQFSKSLVEVKWIQLIQKDLEGIETSKKVYKLWYLNQSYIFHLVALWEVFIEQQVRFGFEQMARLRLLGVLEPVLRSNLEERIKNLHVPDRRKIDGLFYEFMGMEKLSDAWTWENMPREKALQKFDDILKARHEIAHKSRTGASLSFDENFEDMKHLVNLAYLTDYEVEKYVASLSVSEFNLSFQIPYPTEPPKSKKG